MENSISYRKTKAMYLYKMQCVHNFQTLRYVLFTCDTIIDITFNLSSQCYQAIKFPINNRYKCFRFIKYTIRKIHHYSLDFRTFNNTASLEAFLGIRNCKRELILGM